MRPCLNFLHRRATLWLAAGALILALWGMAPALFLAQEKTALPPELALVPTDAFAFVHIRPAELWNSRLGAKARKQVPEEALTEMTKGIDVADLESVTLVAPTAATLAMFMFQEKRTTRPTKMTEKKFGDKKDFEKKDFEEKKPFKEPPKLPEKKSDSKDGASVNELSRDQFAVFAVSAQGPKEVEPESTEPAVLAIVTTVKPADQEKVTKALLMGPATEEKHNGKSYFTNTRKAGLWFMSEKTYVFATALPFLKQIMDRGEKERGNGPLSAAIELAAKKQQVVAGFNFMDPMFQKGLKSMVAEMNHPYRDEPVWAIVPLLSTRGATLSMNLAKDNEIQLQASLGYSDPERAEEALGSVQDALALARIFTLGKMVHQMRSHAEEGDFEGYFYMLLFKQAENALRKAEVARRQATIQVQVQARIDIDAIREEAKTSAKIINKGDGPTIPRRHLVQSSNNLKQMGLALHAHMDVFKFLPPRAICSKQDGKPLLSWRVAILPYIEEQALLNEFKLDEPWDSPNNIKLLPRMPKVYAPPGMKTKEPFTTFYQAFAGANTGFDIRPDKTSPLGAKGIRIFDCTDGTSNTIAIVEAGEAVPWTKPEDVPFDEKKPLPKLGGIFNGGFHVALMDASVRFIKGVAPQGTEPIDAAQMHLVTEATLRNAIIRNDGNVLGPDW